MNYVAFFIAALTVVYYIAQDADANATVLGVSKGGFEGNELFIKIFKTNKPTKSQLVKFNIAQYLVIQLPLIAAWIIFGNPFFGGFALGASIAFPINSYLGVREWSKWEKS